MEALSPSERIEINEIGSFLNSTLKPRNRAQQIEIETKRNRLLVLMGKAELDNLGKYEIPHGSERKNLDVREQLRRKLKKCKCP